MGPLSLEARYPSHKERLALALNTHTCCAYITKTEAMLQWIQEKL